MDFWTRLLTYSKQKKVKVKITWLGLDNAGKTTFIQYILSGTFQSNISRTVGLSVDKFVYQADNNVEIISWDLGGQTHFRKSLWNRYMQNSDGIIFVVDSTDSKRFSEAKNELWSYVLQDKKKKIEKAQYKNGTNTENNSAQYCHYPQWLVNRKHPEYYDE